MSPPILDYAMPQALCPVMSHWSLLALVGFSRLDLVYMLLYMRRYVIPAVDVFFRRG